MCKLVSPSSSQLEGIAARDPILWRRRTRGQTPQPNRNSGADSARDPFGNDVDRMLHDAPVAPDGCLLKTQSGNGRAGDLGIFAGFNAADADRAQALTV